VFEVISRMEDCTIVAPRRRNIAHHRRSWPAKCKPFVRRYFDAVELAGLGGVYIEIWRPRLQDQVETTARRAGLK
jgi:hypothetical protein